MMKGRAVCWGMLVLFFVVSQRVQADVQVVREVTIAPKKGRVVANVGSVKQSYNIRLTDARVNTEVGKVPFEAALKPGAAFFL